MDSEDSDEKDQFLLLRANGWSLRAISKKLGVAKSTLFDWESDSVTRRRVDVLKSLQIERLQEQHLPSFEEELIQLSSCLARIERALDKHDFENMRPEFLLRTALQLRTRMQKLRIDTNPLQTLNKGPGDKAVSGCISRSDNLRDTCESQTGEGAVQKPQSNPESTAPAKEDHNSPSLA